ncbi:MAG: hypothetical protein WC708_00340 [Lentisphaeria bacterium]|jgi:chromosome segregation ATPase
MGLFDLLERTGLVKSTDTDDKPSPVKGSEPKVAVAAVVVPKSTGVDPAKIAAIDESVRKELTGAVDASGSRFVTELTDTLTTLEDVVTDETKRYETALKLLKKKGVSITDIVGDLDSCIGALEAKDREFRNQLQDQFKKKVGSRQEAVQGFTDSIAAKQAQIESLQLEINQARSQRDEAQRGITEEQSKLDLVTERFSIAYKSIRAVVEAQRTKISQHGGSV